MSEWKPNEMWHDDASRDWKPEDKKCRHEQCPECHGTGRKRNGEVCVHYLYCDCPKCRIMLRA